MDHLCGSAGTDVARSACAVMNAVDAAAAKVAAAGTVWSSAAAAAGTTSTGLGEVASGGGTSTGGEGEEVYSWAGGGRRMLSSTAGWP